MASDKRKVPCEVWSRIVGYLRPISSWNPGKVAEFEDRIDYIVGEAPTPIGGQDKHEPISLS